MAHRAVARALETGADVCIVDTAGRLQTQQNLMQQLTKIHRVLGKQIPDAPHEVLLVLDATTGQNGISQAQHFTDAVRCTGIVLAKLDGTAKGGVVVAIRKQVGLPVKYIGVGEKAEDLALFEPDAFVDALFDDLVGAPASELTPGNCAVALARAGSSGDGSRHAPSRARWLAAWATLRAIPRGLPGDGGGYVSIQPASFLQPPARSRLRPRLCRCFGSIRFVRHVDSSIAEPKWRLGGHSSSRSPASELEAHLSVPKSTRTRFKGLENGHETLEVGTGRRHRRPAVGRDRLRPERIGATLFRAADSV